MTNTAVILPISKITLLGGTNTTLTISGSYQDYISVFENRDEVFVALPIQNRAHSGIRSREDFHELGVSFKVNSIAHVEHGTSLTITTLERIQVEEIFQDDGIWMADFVSAPEEQDLAEHEREDMVGYIKNTVCEISDALQAGMGFKRNLDMFNKLNPLMVYLARYMQISDEERYELLACSSEKKRALMFLDFLMRQKESVKLNMEVNEKFSRQANKFYRQQALRQQLKVIQDELNEESGDNADNAEKSWSQRIEEAGLPQEVYKVAMEEARKLEKGNASGADQGVSEKYLDFILALPWHKAQNAEISLPKAREILDADHYGLEQVKKRILQHLAVMALRQENKGSAILLVGPPGTGKTSLGKSVAKALGREYVRMSLGGVRDEAEIRGHRRTYVGAMPGRILESIKRAGTSNPLMVLDEIDKLAYGGMSGDPAAAMLEVLDPAQNSTFTDHYLDLPYDLSNVFFIATANSLDTIPQPLLDRMEVIDISGYTPDEKFQIARRHLLAGVLEETGLKADQLEISDEVLTYIVSEYTAEAGVRGLRKQLAKLARHAAQSILMGEAECFVVTKEVLPDILGHQVARHQKAGESNPAGVVTGLAWTPVGGEILFIETTDMPGSGHVTITGQLGDVMKESAQISLSLLKSRLPMNAAIFKEKDLHIHVPNGSTPKDGPSAGITLFTALASLVTGRPVSSQLAMTGEITLRGDVMPIGGLREKLYGAQRAGITKVLIPYDNLQDLKDVAPEVLDRLEVVPVKTVEDVLKEALGIQLPRIEHMLMDSSAFTSFQI